MLPEKQKNGCQFSFYRERICSLITSSILVQIYTSIGLKQSKNILSKQQ